MNNIRCIAFDLDGTALGPNGTLTPATITALSRAAEQDVKLVVASGRALYTIPDDVMSLPNLSHAVTGNGAAMFDLSDRTCTRRLLLPSDTVDSLVDCIKREDLVAEGFINGVAYGHAHYVADPAAFGTRPFMVDYIRSTRTPVDDMNTFLREHKHELDSIDFITPDNEKKMRLWDEVARAFPTLRVTSSVPQRLEIANAQAGKGNGLLHVLEQLDISPQETIAFGDADNDLEMVAWVGHGVAMGNATDSVKQVATHLTVSNTEDGLARALTDIFGF